MSDPTAGQPYPQTDRWHRVHKPQDPECPYIVCKCDPTAGQPTTDAGRALRRHMSERFGRFDDHDGLVTGILTIEREAVARFLDTADFGDALAVAMGGWNRLPSPYYDSIAERQRAYLRTSWKEKDD